MLLTKCKLALTVFLAVGFLTAAGALEVRSALTATGGGKSGEAVCRADDKPDDTVQRGDKVVDVPVKLTND